VDSITLIIFIFFVIPLLFIVPLIISMFFKSFREYERPVYVDDESDGSNYVTMPDGERRLD
jgi:hypothetical protein